MNNIEHASVNGVEIHNLAEQDCEEDLLYTGELWMGGRQVGSFREVLDKDMKINYVDAEGKKKLQEAVDKYLDAVRDEDDAGELPNDIFYMDLIEMECYFQAFKEGLEEGYTCLLVDYTGGQPEFYSVDDENEIEKIVRENRMEDFQVFSEPDHFVIDC